MRNITDIQDKDMISQRCKEVEKLIGEMEVMWQREEKYWM